MKEKYEMRDVPQYIKWDVIKAAKIIRKPATPLWNEYMVLLNRHLVAGGSDEDQFKFAFKLLLEKHNITEADMTKEIQA